MQIKIPASFSQCGMDRLNHHRTQIKNKEDLFESIVKNQTMDCVRWSKEFIVHPDALKQGLQPGGAFYITKVGKFWQDKIRVKYV
jgi:hypothetical protein